MEFRVKFSPTLDSVLFTEKKFLLEGLCVSGRIHLSLTYKFVNVYAMLFLIFDDHLLFRNP